jgi:predicted phage terminase large subunit-like protein
MTKPPEIAPIKFLHTVRAWDLAFSEKQVNKGNPDFSVGCKMGLFKTDNDYFYVILDLVRWRGLWPVTKRAIIDLAKTEGTGVKLVLESGGPQKGLADDMKAEIDLKHIIIHAENPVADKVARAQVWADKAEAGKIMLLEAAWNADFLSECSDFPNSEHDDQVDSVSLAYYNLSSRYVRRQSFLTVGISGLYSHG